MSQVNQKVDGINLNASHFAKMSKEVAVERMKADGILDTHGKDLNWAAKAHDACVEAVKESQKPVKPKK